MQGIVFKKAILEATKSSVVKHCLEDYEKVVPCTVKFKPLDLDNDKTFIEVKHNSKEFIFYVPKKHIFVKHKSITNPIPLSLWKAADEFSNLRRVARREEAIYNEEIPLTSISKENFSPKGHNGHSVVELCFDKGSYECDFCDCSINLTRDHIVPMSWKYSRLSPFKDFIKDVKMNSTKNFQVLCVDCHKEKTKFENDIIYLPKIFKIENTTISDPVYEILMYCNDRKVKKLSY